MRSVWGIIAAIGLAGFVTAMMTGCSGSGSPNGAGSIGRAELRQAAPVSAVRMRAADLETESIAFVREQRAVLGLGAHDDFAHLRTHRSADGGNHVRLQQLHDGIKVWGADLVVHGDDATLHSVDGNVLASLVGLDLAPSVSDGSALSMAKSDYARAAVTAEPLQYQRELSELVILPLGSADGGRARLTWHVRFFTDVQGGIAPGLWEYFIDAHDGSIVQQYNALETANVEASGTGGNARVTRNWNMNLDVVQSGTTYAMNTTQVETTNLKGSTSGTGTPYSGSSLTNFNTGEPGANDAHGFAEITLKMLKDWPGYNSIDNAGYKIVSRVHYSSKYDNAFWDGTEMSYGDGDGTQFYQFTGALDVIAHEIDHGFTSNHSNLAYTGQSGGMNEAFSDIAGTTAKFYDDATHADFNLGGDIFIQPNQYIRYMCTPSKDGKSIDNASQYTASLDVHYSSGVMNRAFCRASKRLSGVDPDTGTATADGVKKAAKAWYVANANYWTSSTQWTAGCQGVVDAATKTLMYPAGDIAALGDSWKDVGVTCTYTHVNDFTLSLTPATATAAAGSTATFSVVTGVPAGSTAQPLTLAVGGLGGGVTGSFNPTTVQSGATSTLTLTIPATTPAGDVAFTVTANGATPRTAAGTLTVTAPPPDMTPPPPPPDMADHGGGGNGGTGGGGGSGGTGGSGGGTGGNGGTGGSGGGNGNHGGSGCRVVPGGANASSGLFLLLVFAAVIVSRRRA